MLVYHAEKQERATEQASMPLRKELLVVDTTYSNRQQPRYFNLYLYWYTPVYILRYRPTFNVDAHFKTSEATYRSYAETRRGAQICGGNEDSLFCSRTPP